MIFKLILFCKCFNNSETFKFIFFSKSSSFLKAKSKIVCHILNKYSKSFNSKFLSRIDIFHSFSFMNPFSK